MADQNDRIPNPGEAAAILEMDRLGRKPKTRRIDGLVWPGGTARFSLRVLRVDEVQLARAAAVRHFTKQLDWKPDALNSDEFTEETLVQILARAIEACDDDGKPTGKPLFASASQLRSECERDEVEQVWLQYVDLREQHEPDEEVDADTFERVLAFLKKKDTSLLRQLAPSTLRGCLLTMANLLEASPTDRSSSSSLSSEPIASE